MTLHKCFGAMLFVAVSGTAAAAQTGAAPLRYCDVAAAQPAALSGAMQDLLRMSEISEGEPSRPRALIRPSDALTGDLCPGGSELPWSLGPVRLGLVAPILDTRLRTGYPDDRNNGAAWAGRGLSTTVSAGLTLRAGPLTAAVAPVLTYQQNSEFTIGSRDRPGYSPFAGRFSTAIDQPQRFGDEAYSTVHAGQSFARIDGFGAVLGVSSENLWVGPAARNPILMSNTAPGFAHVFFGTSTPLDIWIGDLTAQGALGRLDESDYFDSISDNDETRLAMWVVALQPRLLEGLEIGVARVYLYRPEDVDGLGELTVLFQDSKRNLEGNELAGIFARWVLAEADAEVYGEWTRDDRYAGWVEDLIPEPDHSQAYMIGFQKLSPVGQRFVRLQAELTHLQEKGEPRGGRSLPIYYTHHRIRQGYTHRGQILGAGIGPGADAQYIGVDLLDEWGFGGVFVERVRRNDASQLALEARAGWPYSHDVELTAGLRGLLRWRDFAGWATTSYSYRWLRDFIEDDANFALELGITWLPRPASGDGRP